MRPQGGRLRRPQRPGKRRGASPGGEEQQQRRERVRQDLRLARRAHGRALRVPPRRRQGGRPADARGALPHVVRPAPVQRAGRGKDDLHGRPQGRREAQVLLPRDADSAGTDGGQERNRGQIRDDAGQHRRRPLRALAGERGRPRRQIPSRIKEHFAAPGGETVSAR